MKELLTQEDVLALLKVSRTTLYRMRCNGLRYYSKGKKIYFFKEEILKWIKK